MALARTRAEALYNFVFIPIFYVVLGLAATWWGNYTVQKGGFMTAHQTTAVESRYCDVATDGLAIQRFAKFLTYRTIGDADAEDHILAGHHQAFTDALAFLESSYPEVHSRLQVEKLGVGGWTRLYTWKGTDPSLDPVLFISHYDVVPVENEHDWTHGPFDGHVADDFVWGRGALDVKVSVTSLLEAATRLLQADYTPTRTVLITFGHDEEVGGGFGAATVAKHLEEQHITLDMVVDEGGCVLRDGIDGLTTHPVAMVATAEKVYTSLELTFRASGGHSSMPPIDHSDIGSQLARFIAHLTTNKPKGDLIPPTSDFIRAVQPYVPFYYKPIFANQDTWGIRFSLIENLKSAGPEMSAMVRTTVVPVRIQAGVADNVMPQVGHLTLNARQHPSEPRQDLIDYILKILNTSQLQTEMVVSNKTHFGQPGVVTDADGPHFRLLKQAIQELWRFEDQPVAVLPYLLTGGTDSKHFTRLSPNGVLRFVPYSINRGAGELATIHANDERVRAADYALSICTYERVISLLSGPAAAADAAAAAA